MSYLNAKQAREDYTSLRAEILRHIDEDKARVLIPIIEKYLLAKRSFIHHEKMKQRSKALRTSVKGKLSSARKDKPPIEGPKYVYSPPPWAYHFSSCPESLREEIREHTTKDVFKSIEYYWKDKSTGRIILKDIDGLDLSTSE